MRWTPLQRAIARDRGLGHDSDGAVAQRAGVSRAWVAITRRRVGVAAQPRRGQRAADPARVCRRALDDVIAGRDLDTSGRWTQPEACTGLRIAVWPREDE